MKLPYSVSTNAKRTSPVRQPLKNTGNSLIFAFPLMKHEITSETKLESEFPSLINVKAFWNSVSTALVCQSSWSKASSQLYNYHSFHEDNIVSPSFEQLFILCTLSPWWDNAQLIWRLMKFRQKPELPNLPSLGLLSTELEYFCLKLLKGNQSQQKPFKEEPTLPRALEQPQKSKTTIKSC